MGYFVYVRDNRVVDGMVADQEFIDHIVANDLYPQAGTGQWIETCINTQGNQLINGATGTPLRKNYAGIGYIYDPELDAFYPPRPYDSWSLDKESGTWQPPTPYPDDGKPYAWDITTNAWIEIAYTGAPE